MATYCIDSCSLMKSMRDRYPIDSFPGLWEQLGSAFESKMLVSSKLVLDEIKKGDDDLVKWVKPYEKYFVEVDSAQLTEVGTILNKHKGLVDPKATRESADPYLVALAKINEYVLVTEEERMTLQPNSKKTKLPNVCETENIRCIRIVDMIKELGWKFK